jgi:hypothetical protein
MPRKSFILRLSQAQELLAEWKLQSREDDKRALFVRDMIFRMGKRKQLSSKQKAYLDSLIEQGVPEWKGDQALLDRVDHALTIEGTEGFHRPLKDMRTTIVRGYNLSEKQQAFIEKLLGQADDIERDGPWIPSSAIQEKLQTCLALAKSRNGMYWQTHPADGKALLKVQDWAAGEAKFLDKWAADRLIQCFRVAFRELDDPYAKNGQIIWVRVQNNYQVTYPMGLITSLKPIVNERGHIVYEVLADGAVLYKRKEEMMKRRPR